MKWRIRLCGLILAASTLAPLRAAAAGAWTLSWNEEFNAAQVDPARWGYEIGYVRNQEKQYYANRPENSRIEAGNLLIRALRDNWSGHEYTSASRTTRGKKSFKYGRFEMRARIDIRAGSWPAWWWLPDAGGWPKGGEIDMMEFYQSKCLFNVMDGNGRWTSPTRSIASLGGARWAEQFHVWTMEWDSTRIDLSLDGTLINHYPVANADGTGPAGKNPFRQSGYMILNQAIGGTQGGDPSGTAFPVDFRVDWVRVHAWDPRAAASMVTVKGGTGSGPYVAGTPASITAGMPPVGQVFDKWVAEPAGAAIDAPASPSAVLTVPQGNVTVTAVYKPGSGIAILPGAGRGAGVPEAPAAWFDPLGKRFRERALPVPRPGILRLRGPAGAD